jgi:prephenate dehydratase
MSVSIAYLGPTGTYTELAALTCATWLKQTTNQEATLEPYPSIARAIKAVSSGQTQLAVVPVENSIEGGVTVTLDTLWQRDNLQIQKALVLPISNALISHAKSLDSIKTVYSHPQPLAQCQGWLESFLPSVELVPTNSTTEALKYLGNNTTKAAIASQRAAQLYNLPTLAHPINDHPDNCTRFWILGVSPSVEGTHTSLAFSFPANLPGALTQALQIFAQRNINLSRIESRPTKRSLGDYLFFIDIEADQQNISVESALAELSQHTETLKVFGSYAVLPVQSPSID